ncbi:MAG: YeiH family protein [Bosea sp. (in: a-proteobacteria)]
MNAATLQRLAPGFGLAMAVAIVSWAAEPLLKAATGGLLALPAMVIALIIGIALFAFASRPAFEPGLTFCVKKLLRWAIGLLGLRIALGDIIGLGLTTALIVVISMALTIASGIWLARALGRADGFGALAGAACAVCGASATLATATVVPDYKEKAADIAFTVVMANAISTLVMLAYPPFCVMLGLSAQETGVMLGATIHDMAQVVGAGYAVSEPVGNTAVIVKLFRVFLLLPVVLIIGWWFAAQAKAGSPAGSAKAKVPMPVFALVFLALCLLNSVMAANPALSASIGFPAIKAWLGSAATWGLLIAIAALGLGTSLKAILSIGWRHAAVFMGATLAILLSVLVPLMLLR